MATLDKINIRGIRSFGPNDEQKVKFSTPLTLILGQNGCGKTTIIECLKYALTNDLPAGSESGRGFVNDPKLSNKSTTKACVKLKFKDGKGDFITVGKFVEVSTLAGGKLKFKSMSPSIRWEDSKGNFDDISGRCQDVDLYCAQKLNVSKPIINNVIFCHQENSSWPLDEAKRLKDRFDEIFGSTDYNKCVDKLRKAIKAKKGDIKVLKEQFEQKKMAKRNTEKLKDSVAEKESRLEEIQRSIEDKLKDLEPLQTKLDEVNKLMDSLSSTHQKLTGLETTLKGILEQQNALKKHIVDEFEGTDQELDHEILNFHTFQEEAKREISEKESKKDTVDSKIQGINQALQKLQVSFGQLKEEEAQHKRRCEELKEMIEKAKVKFRIETEDGEPIPDILYKLNASFKSRELRFASYQKSGEDEGLKLQKVIDDIRDKFAAAKESYSSKSKIIEETNKKIREAKFKLTQLSNSNSQQESIEKRLKDAKEALAKKKEDFNEDEQLHQLEELDEVITQKDQMQSKLEREHRILLQNSLTDQKIDSENNLIMEKRGEIANLKHKHDQSFHALFGQEVPHEKFEQAVFKVQRKEDEKVKSITNNISTYEKKVATLEASVKHASDKLQSYKDELSRNKNKIESVCKGKVFSEILEQSHAKKEKLQKEKGAYRSAKTLYEQFIKEFEKETPCCPICDSDFSSKTTVVPSIIGKLKRRIEDFPRKLIETEGLLKKEEDLYNKLQRLTPVSENIQMLEEAKIPLLEDELQQNKEMLEETTLELASMKNELVEPQNLVETCRKVISDAALLDRLHLELKRSENLVETLKKDLVTVSSKRTLDETETELSKLKAELNNLRRQYRTMRDLFDETKDSIQKLNGRVQIETQKKLEIQKLLQEWPLIEKQQQEYRAMTTQLEQEKKMLAEKKTELEKELNQAEKNRSDAVRKHKLQLEELREDIDGRRRDIEDIQKIHNVIQRYENGESKNKMGTILKELEEGKSNISKLEQGKKVLMDFIVKKKEELASQESKFRSLNDNKDLRLNRVKSRELENQIRDLKKQIGHHNSRTITEERRKVIQKIDTIQTDVSRKTGEQDTIKELIRSTKLELNKKEHKDAILDYKKKYYEMRVEELAADDLDLYTEALEKSILKFHQERMVQINMIIRDLWRSIYKGNDIDYIEIKTDAEFTGGATKRRSYNYKVVQVKKGIELEMRGRCSAGQKVLACLVIRMALAESFSTNCGILALDEPTTNLDKANIESLSDALSRIIAARERQKNFQLLIITHDEEFLQTLTRDQSVSHYLRVQRNHDGFSEIIREIL